MSVSSCPSRNNTVGGDYQAEPHLFDRIDHDLAPASVLMQAGVMIVAEQQHERRRDVDDEAHRVRDKARPPNLHRVKQREAEHQPARNPAGILAGRTAHGGWSGMTSRGLAVIDVVRLRRTYGRRRWRAVEVRRFSHRLDGRVCLKPWLRKPLPEKQFVPMMRHLLLCSGVLASVACLSVASAERRPRPRPKRCSGTR